MNKPLTIRRYQSNDDRAVRDLSTLALQAAGFDPELEGWDRDLHHINETYLQDGCDFLVGICDSNLIAMGALRRTSSHTAEIKRMRVHPDYQRRGFGQAILAALEKRALELGYPMLCLDTTVPQTAAQRLYEKNGYVVVRHGKIGKFDCLFYEKQLEPSIDED